jgi:hypothetical protein
VLGKVWPGGTDVGRQVSSFAGFNGCINQIYFLPEIRHEMALDLRMSNGIVRARLCNIFAVNIGRNQNADKRNDGGTICILAEIEEGEEDNQEKRSYKIIL